MVRATDAPPRTTYLIGRLDRIVRRALEERLRGHGLTVPGYTTLTVLAARPGLSNSQLARRSFVTPQGMNQVIAVLADKGLICRTPDTENRRVQRIELTAQGHQLVETCNAMVAEYESELLAVLEPRQREEFHDLLSEVVNANRSPFGLRA